MELGYEGWKGLADMGSYLFGARPWRKDGEGVGLHAGADGLSKEIEASQ